MSGQTPPTPGGGPPYGVAEQAEDIARLEEVKAKAYAVRHRLLAAERERGLTKLTERKFYLTDGATTGMLEVAALAGSPGAKDARSLWLAIAAGYEEYVAVRGTVQEALAERSWFLPDVLDPGDVLALKRIVDHRTPGVLDRAMVQIARRAGPFVGNRMRALFPSRWPLLEEAFRAHREELYGVSVPTMLAQAEGIGMDLWGENGRVMSEKGAGVIGARVADALAGAGLTDETIAAFVGQVSGSNRIRASSGTLDDDDWPAGRVAFLNRHAVLHGFDVAYATEANGLRCVLLLDLLADVCLLLPPTDE